MDKELYALEYNKILERLAEHAVSQPGKEICRSLLPCETYEEAQTAMEETDAAVQLLLRFGAPSFSYLKDVCSSCRRAQSGAVLSIRELIDIAENLRTCESLCGFLEEHESDENKCLHERSSRLLPNKYLSTKLFSSFIGEDEVADAASPALRDIRRRETGARDRIRTTLDSIVRTHAKFLQETIITVRNGRYVIPVKSEHRGEINGLIHDTSSSGATVFIEPMGVVSANNDLSVLEAQERAETERILAALSAEVGDFADNIVLDFEICRFFDFCFAKARYATQLKASRPSLNTRGVISFRGARHPLINPDVCVPVDIEIGKKYTVLMITGPNTGGKTVSLKTTGLLCLMAKSGLFLPVKDGSEAAFFDRVFADIGDDQSIEQSLSTFSSHMTNIIGILKGVTDNSIVLLDELGSGTDPVEGAALATAIIEKLRGTGARVAATTHYAELKLYALGTQGVENASCEFDVATLRPTYRLILGIPGRSNAFAIASRLGMEDGIIDEAKRRLDSESVRMENVIADLEINRKNVELEAERAEQMRADAAATLKKAQETEQSAQDIVNKQLNEAREKAYDILEQARRDARRTLESLDEIRRAKEREDFKARIEQGRKELLQNIDNAQAGLSVREKRVAKPIEGKLKKGDDVHVISLDKEAVVLSEPDAKGMVQLQIGLIKTKLHISDIERSTKAKKTAVRLSADTRGIARGSRRVSTELDIRGMSALEADGLIDEFLDNCSLAGLNSVSIIHGKGTGVLRAAVHEKLRTCKQVDTFRVGVYGEGDNGVTIVTLK